MASIARLLRPTATRFSSRSFNYAPLRTQRSLSASIRLFSASQASRSKRYSTDHEWISLSDDAKTGTIGISDYAAHALGDVVYVELPTIDTEVAAGDTIGAVESVKSASDINAPVSCKIIEVNMLLEEKPGTINLAPEDDTAGGGWIAKIEVTEESVKQLEGLMDAEAYKKFHDTE